MTRLATAVALLLVVTTSVVFWAGEKRLAATPATTGTAESRDVRKTPPATRRLATDRDRSLEEDRRERAMIIGLMMLMGPRHKR